MVIVSSGLKVLKLEILARLAIPSLLDSEGGYALGGCS